jgi:molecular chaperone DnaK
MMKEGEQFAQQDRIKKEEAETRNNADTLLYTVEKTKKDFAEKIKKKM